MYIEKFRPLKTITLKQSDLDIFIVSLQKTLGGDLSNTIKEKTLKIDSSIGYGFIRASKLKGGIIFIQFKVTFYEDILINFNIPSRTYVNFGFCSEGKIYHNFKDEDRCVLDTFQTAILINIDKEYNSLFIEKDKQISASFISINTKYSDSQPYKINEKLRENFITDAKGDEMYVSNASLKIAKTISNLNTSKKKGLVKALLVESTVHLILALELEQYERELFEKNQNCGSLSADDMKEINELSKFINNYPDTALTVKELADKIGLTPAKLQEGFKLMHDSTVNNYIRDVRISKSEELMKTTDMNISQILYSLGFSSRSYFSKIFKEKYQLSPKQYKNQNKNVSSEN